MNLREFFSRLNPFATRASSVYQLLMLGGGGYQNPVYKYERYATEGYQMNSVVFACLGKIIQAMQSVQWAFEKDGERIEEKELSKELRILQALLNDPDPYTTRDEFITEYILYLYIGGIAFMRVSQVKPDGTERLGYAPELILERPDKVAIQTKGRQVIGFKVQRNSGPDYYSADEMTFIRLMNPLYHLSGQPPMQACALEIDTLNAGRKLNAKTLEDGGTLKSVIALKGQRNVAAEKMTEIIGKFWERYDTAKAVGKPFVFSADGADFHTLSQTMSELDWAGNEGIMARRICNVFNVPSQLIGDPDTSKYSNYQEAMKDFYINNILPSTGLLLGKYSRWLVPMYDISGVRLAADASSVAVMQEDIGALVDWLAKATWWSDNEKRERQGMEPSNSEGADELGAAPVNNAFLKTDADEKESKRSIRSVDLDHVDERSMYRTEESRVTEFRRKDNIRKRNEKKYIDALNKYFGKQRDRLIEAFVNATGGKRTDRAIKDDPLLFLIEDTFVADTFLRLNENLKYVEDLNELTRGIVVDFGQDAIDQFTKEGLVFNIERPGMQEFIADDMFARSELINNTQAESLQRVITDGYNKGLSQDAIANTITDKYDEISAGRAKTIARTEVGRSAGIATQEGFVQAGVAFREWLSARDGDVRRGEHSHEYMDGKIEALDDPFTGQGGESSMTVPPTSGVPGFDINCRCVSVPLETREDAI